MAKKRSVFKNIVASVSKAMVKASNGTASFNYTYQPKRPAGLKKSK